MALIKGLETLQNMITRQASTFKQEIKDGVKEGKKTGHDEILHA